MSFRIRKKATGCDQKRDHRFATYYESIVVKFDGVYLNSVVETVHARNTMCRIYGYHEVQDLEEPEVKDEGLQPGDFSVSSLEDKLDEGDFDSVLPELLEAEKGGKNRKTAIEAIEDRIELTGE